MDRATLLLIEKANRTRSIKGGGNHSFVLVKGLFGRLVLRKVNGRNFSIVCFNSKVSRL